MFKGVTLCRLSIARVCFAGGFIEVLNSAQDQATEVGMDLRGWGQRQSGLSSWL